MRTLFGTYKRSRRTFLSISVIGLVLAPQVGVAQSQQNDESAREQSGDLSWAQREFRALDSDRDGVVEWQDLQDAHADKLSDQGWDQKQVFSQFDRDNDQTLDENEYLVFISHLLDEQLDQPASAADERSSGSQRQTAGGERVVPFEADGTEPDPEVATDRAVESVDGAVVPNSGPNDAAMEPPIYDTQIAIAAAEGGLEYLPPQAIKDSKIVNLKAEEIGKIQDIVTAPGGTTASLVVQIGGFFGIGATEVLVPFDEIYVVGQQLVWETELGPDKIKNLERYGYDRQGYTSIIEDENGFLEG